MKKSDNIQSIDLIAALSKWIPLASTGDAEAQFNVGLIYKDGDGVSQDFTEAVKWYRREADHRFRHAQYSLGFIYHLEEGVSQNYSGAAEWYRRASEL